MAYIACRSPARPHTPQGLLLAGSDSARRRRRNRLLADDAAEPCADHGLQGPAEKGPEWRRDRLAARTTLRRDITRTAHELHYLEGQTVHPALVTATLIASSNGRHFHIGPWIIVPILIVAAIIGTVVFTVRDRRKRRSHHSVQLRTALGTFAAATAGLEPPSSWLSFRLSGLPKGAPVPGSPKRSSARPWCRSRCTALVCSQIIILCIRAITLTASGVSPGAGRSW
jgi:general stress protein CsbA